MKKSIKILSVVATVMSATAVLISGYASDKEMEQKIEDAVQKRLNPPEEDEEA